MARVASFPVRVAPDPLAWRRSRFAHGHSSSGRALAPARRCQARGCMQAYETNRQVPAVLYEIVQCTAMSKAWRRVPAGGPYMWGLCHTSTNSKSQAPASIPRKRKTRIHRHCSLCIDCCTVSWYAPRGHVSCTLLGVSARLPLQASPVLRRRTTTLICLPTTCDHSRRRCLIRSPARRRSLIGSARTSSDQARQCACLPFHRTCRSGLQPPRKI